MAKRVGCTARAVVVCLALAGSSQALAQQSTGNAKTSSSPAGSSGAPHVTVATVRLENGYRASKIIGAPVYSEQSQQVGTVADLFLSRQNTVAMVVLAVGGVLGVGGKSVVVPMDKLQISQENKVVMPGVNKDTLNQMPNVTYGD